MRVSRAIVIVDPGDARTVLVFDRQLDWPGGVHRELDGLPEAAGNTGHDTVDRLNLHARRQTGFKGRPFPADCPYLALVIYAQTERIPETRRFPARLQRFIIFAGLLRINEPVAATSDPVERVSVEATEAFQQKTSPIIGQDIVQYGRDIFEGVGLRPEAAIFDAEEAACKVIEGIPSLGLLADQRIRVEPDQQTLIIVI